MFAVGHLALGYLTGKPASKLVGTTLNISLLFLASILPDVDLLVPGLHRGPTHSLVVYALFFVPFFLMFGKKTVIYFVALIQHSLLGDFLVTSGTTGVQLLWPLTPTWYSAPVSLAPLTDVYAEWALFIVAMMLMLGTKDFWKLFEPHPTNLLLTVPVVAIILPVFLGIPLSVPFVLAIPHLVYLVLLGASILIDFRALVAKKTG